MSDPKAKVEGVLFGTVVMLSPLLLNFSPRSDIFTTTIDNLPGIGTAYQLYGIYRKDSQRSQCIGAIAIQQLPAERVLVTFDPVPWFAQVEHITDAHTELFWSLVNQLMGRFMQLGFAPLPDAPKVERPFGFVPRAD